MNYKRLVVISAFLMILITGCSGQAGSRALSLTTAGTLSVSINPQTIMIGNSTVATIQLNNYSSHIPNFIVELNNSNPNTATMSASSCTLSSNTPSCTVTLTGESIGHTTITASNINYASSSANLTVNNAPGSLSLSLAQSPILVGESTTAILQFTTDGVVVAPFTVMIESSNPSYVTVSPLSCTLSSSESTCIINIVGESVGKTTLYTSTTNYASSSANLTVNNAPGSVSLSLAQSPILLGESTTATLQFTTDGVVAPFTVMIESSNPSYVAVSPLSCTLSSSESTCIINIVGESVGRTTLYTSTTNYASESVSIKVNNDVPGDLQLTLESYQIAAGESTFAIITLESSAGIDPFWVHFAVNESAPNIINIPSPNCLVSPSNGYSCRVNITTGLNVNESFLITAQDESGKYSQEFQTLIVGSGIIESYAYIAQESSIMQCIIESSYSFSNCFNSESSIVISPLGIDINPDTTKIYIPESTDVKMCNIGYYHALDFGSCTVAADSNTLFATLPEPHILTGGLSFESAGFAYLTTESQVLGCNVNINSGAFTSCSDASNFAAESGYTPSNLTLFESNGVILAYVTSLTPSMPDNISTFPPGAVIQCVVDLSSGALTDCDNPNFGTNGGLPLFEGPSAIIIDNGYAYVTNGNNYTLTSCPLNGTNHLTEPCTNVGNVDGTAFYHPSDIVLAANQISYITTTESTSESHITNSVIACNMANPEYPCQVVESGLDNPAGIALSH